MRVTVCQLRDDPVGFEQDWLGLCRHVREQHSELVLLPELPFAPWFALERLFDAAKWEQVMMAHREWDGRLGELAPSSIIATRPIERSGSRYNEAYAVEAGGARTPVHDKRYLPDEPGFYEASWDERGDGVFAPATVAGARVGMLICSELWVMDRARAYAEQGVEVIATPRATPDSTRERWLLAGRTAAILAGAFALSSNHAGVSAGGFRFAGAGWIISPDGELLAVTSEETPYQTRDIDLAQARAAKNTYPRYLQ